MTATHAALDPARTATGPRTTAGKEVSRRNSGRHFYSGSGAVIPEEDLAEVDRRARSYVTDLGITTQVGRDLARLVAVMALRMDHLANHEAVAIAHNRRHAIDRHDDARQDEADRLFQALGEDPRIHLRRLRRMPEGCELLIEAWKGLKVDLARPRPRWTEWHRERAENLTGNRSDNNPYTAIGDLSGEIRGESRGPLAEDTPAEAASKARGRARMVERIDAEVAALEAHVQTLDHETLELDRLEAPDRALFDDSLSATLARRYEAEASRRFFKLMAQIRQVEAEAAERPAAPVAPPIPPPSRSFREFPRQEPYAPVGGFGGTTSPVGRDEAGQDASFVALAVGKAGTTPAHR